MLSHLRCELFEFYHSLKLLNLLSTFTFDGSHFISRLNQNGLSNLHMS